MDPEPAVVSSPSSQVEVSLLSPDQTKAQEIAEEEPFPWRSPSNALLGLTIAIATIGVPIVAVLMERPLGKGKDSMVPTALDSDGSKTSAPISLARGCKPSC